MRLMTMMMVLVAGFLFVPHGVYGKTNLSGIVSQNNSFLVKEGGDNVFYGDYFTQVKQVDYREEKRVAGNVSRTILTCNNEKISVQKSLVLMPGEAWILWDIKAKEDIQGELGVFFSKKMITPPYIYYQAINQDSPWEVDVLKNSRGAPYDIVSGFEDNFREIQCGTSSYPDWTIQNYGGKGYRFVVSLKIKSGKSWKGVIRYSRKKNESYPPISFDKSRQERGIFASLLSDVVEDQFTIIPARSSKYINHGESLDIALKYYAIDQKKRKIKVKYTLIDMTGTTVLNQSIDIENQGDNYSQKHIYLSPSQNGGYRVVIEYAIGKIKRHRELVFCVIPKIVNTGIRKNSIFGAAMGGGKYTGTLAKRIGLKWNRAWCAIGGVQTGNIFPKRGKPNWKNIDKAIQFHDDYQMVYFATLDEGWKQKWLTQLWEKGKQEDGFDEYIHAYVEEYVRPLATRYKGKIKFWEVTNEPFGKYRQYPEKWVKLLKAVYTTLKEIDPQNTVVGTCGPPGSMGYSWYKRTFALGSLDYQDGVSCHLYAFGGWVGSGLAMKVRQWMTDIRAIMKEHGKVLPLWNTETTVTPPASLYRDPSHTRYIKYHPGETPTNPIEQSQIYFKTLVVHKAENVKYSFHVFHGGIEYTMHTGEYDGTPLSFLATQATLAKYLEEAEYVKDLKLDDHLQVFLFRKGTQLILVPWGPKFLKQDFAEVSIPLSVDRFHAVDVFDNERVIGGNQKALKLKIGWQAFFLFADHMTVSELETAIGNAEIKLNIEENDIGFIKGKFYGEDAGPADRSSWIGYSSISLKKEANRSFEDQVPGDGLGGWTDEGENDMRFLPVGEWVINGIPFKIIDPKRNKGKSCVILKGGLNASEMKKFPEKVVIPVHQRISKVHFLHTITWGGKKNTAAFRYVFYYKDGFKEEVVVRSKKNVADWWYLGDIPEAQIAWEGPNTVRKKVRLWEMTYAITHPKGAQAMMDHIEIISENQISVPVIIAITGVLSN